MESIQTRHCCWQCQGIQPTIFFEETCHFMTKHVFWPKDLLTFPWPMMTWPNTLWSQMQTTWKQDRRGADATSVWYYTLSGAPCALPRNENMHQVTKLLKLYFCVVISVIVLGIFQCFGISQRHAIWPHLLLWCGVQYLSCTFVKMLCICLLYQCNIIRLFFTM